MNPIITAQRLLNLYRQSHVILGGWPALNKIFLNEASPDVINELQNLPKGKSLAGHIASLRAGKTPLNTISDEFLPYGGLMRDANATTHLDDDELTELTTALKQFTPNDTGLSAIKSLNVVQKFGEEWQIAIRSALFDYPKLSAIWNTVIQTARAYDLWKIATDMTSMPISERARAQIQSDLPEFETYLPMFGDAGHQLLSKLREYVSSV